MKEYLGWVAAGIGSVLIFVLYAVSIVTIAASVVGMVGGEITVAAGLLRVVAGGIGLGFLIGTSAYLQHRD